MAFRECYNLKKFEPNEDIQELSWFCFWRTGVTDLRIPPHIRMTREQLGLDQEDPKVLWLPKGLEVVGARWFCWSDIEKVFIPNTVRELGEDAFRDCKRLREVVFAPNSRLEDIGDNCFSNCGFEEVTVPKSVRSIGRCAFQYCRNLQSLTLEEGSHLAHVGKDIVRGTRVDLKKVKFPSTAQIDNNNDEIFIDEMPRQALADADME